MLYLNDPKFCTTLINMFETPTTHITLCWYNSTFLYTLNRVRIKMYAPTTVM